MLTQIENEGPDPTINKNQSPDPKETQMKVQIQKSTQIIIRKNTQKV